MSVQTFQRCFRVHSIRAPFLRHSVHRLYSYQLPLQSTTTNFAEENDDSHQAEGVQTQSTYAPPQLYKSILKPPSRGKGRPQKSKQLEPKTDVEEENARNPLDPGGVELHLASLNAAGMVPTLADLERCRPPRHPDPDSNRYAEAHHKLVDTLCRSFSKDQLMTFMKQYDGHSPASRPGRRKLDYAESIIEQEWGLPSLKDVERAKRDRTEISVQSFPVAPAELFLILGRDGADLLELSKKFNVHMALTSDPLALRVEGVRSSLQGLEERIASLKHNMVSQTFKLPNNTYIRPDLIQRISRLAGAYIEDLDTQGKIMIVAKDPRSMQNAERLAIRAAHESYMSSIIPQLSYVPPNQSASISPETSLMHTYSLYPFLSPRSLPWAMSSKGTFRLRKVAQFLGHSVGDNSLTVDGLASNHGTVTTLSQTSVDLMSILLDGSPQIPTESTGETKRTFTASLGHVLFSANPKEQQTTITPPLAGYHSLPKLQKWMTDNRTRTSFVPSLPHSLVASLPSEQRILHRLIYEVVPLSVAAPTATQLPTIHFMALEIVLAEPSSVHSAEPAPSTDSTDHGPSEKAPFASPPRCTKGEQRTLDLMIPDRPMDVRFTVTDSDDIRPEEWPHDIQTYVADLSTFLNGDLKVMQPDPPVILSNNGLDYVLRATSSIRQSTEVPSSQDQQSTADVVAESVLDLESNQKSTYCEIICTDHSTEGWQDLLRTCDRLSSATYKATSTM